MKKYIILFIFLLMIKLFNFNFINQELSFYKYINIFSYNLYYNDYLVNDINIDVLDYYIYDNKLIIETINNEAKIPISGIIVEYNDDYIVIENKNNKYRINNIKSNYYLYQYYNEGNILGYSNKLIIEGNDYNDILNDLIINYEKI